MDYRIFNVHTDVNACDCTRGCTDTVRESALKVDSRRQIPCLTGEWREYTHTYIGQRVFFFYGEGRKTFLNGGRFGISALDVSRVGGPLRRSPGGHFDRS